MELKFTKMHGLGNDFVVIDAIRQDVALDPDQVELIAVGLGRLDLDRLTASPGSGDIK